MSPIRLLLCALPPLLGLVAWWAAREATAARNRRGGDLIVMLPGALPQLNPFLPASPTETELVDLIYDPLLRIGSDGKLAPALAAQWEWGQQITCWFSTPEIATNAANHLRALDADRWIAFYLDKIVPEGSQLCLRFSSPTGTGPDDILKELSPFDPLPVTFLRIQVKEQARSYHDHFIANAVESRHIRRAWFDRSGQVAELVICGAPGDALDELRQYYLSKPDLAAVIQVLDKVTALREPVLHFQLAPNRLWPDQTPVTSADVSASVKHVLRHGIPVANLDALNAIHTLDTPAVDELRVIYRRFQGAALTSWTHLPILSNAWLEAHGSETDPGFPPGTGPFRPALRRDSTLVLDASPEAPVRIGRIRLQTGASARATHAAFATGGIDLFWPPNERLPALEKESSLILHAGPPKGRVLVMWNLRSPILQDLRIRKALALGTNRPALIEQLLHGAGSLHDGIFQPGIWFSNPPPPLPYDPKKAISLLESAAWLTDATTGLRKKPGGHLAIELLTTAGNSQREQLARLLAAQWRSIGFSVNITALPWSEMLEQHLMARRFDAAIIGLDFDPSWDQLTFWHSTHAANPEALNFSGLSDTDTDLLLESLAGEFDPAAVAKHAIPLEARIEKLAPFLPLFTDRSVVAIRRASLPPDTASGLSLAEWVLEPSKPDSTDPPPSVQMLLPGEALPRPPAESSDKP
jgi:ABC-type transport system substrate-binding protein